MESVVGLPSCFEGASPVRHADIRPRERRAALFIDQRGFGVPEHGYEETHGCDLAAVSLALVERAVRKFVPAHRWIRCGYHRKVSPIGFSASQYSNRDS